MNENFILQCQHYLDHPDLFNVDPEQKEVLLAKLNGFLKDEEPLASDILDLTAAADINFKSMLTKYHVSHGNLITERYIREAVQREDIKELLYIASVYIIKFNGEFYFTRINRIDETSQIRMETMEMLRNLFLKKGYPVNARLISSALSYYQPKSFDNMICSEENLRTYLCGKLYKNAPFCDWLTIKVFNGLEYKDKEKILTWLTDSYKNFRNVERVDKQFISVDVDDEGTKTWLERCDFDLLETDSPLKTELIALQKKLFND